jgi:hypothetical protein
VNTSSKPPVPSTSGASYTLDSTKVTSAPAPAAIARAWATDADEKSRPVIVAPSRASEIVSVPMWHCRCTPRRPSTSPRRGRSKRTTSLMCVGSAANFSTA